MGIDFLGKVKETIIKSIDKGRVSLSTPDLLTRLPSSKPRTVVATLAKGENASAGERLIAELSDGKLNLCRGSNVLGPFNNPPQEFVERIGKTGGVALAKVTRVHALSRKVDIELC